LYKGNTKLALIFQVYDKIIGFNLGANIQFTKKVFFGTRMKQANVTARTHADII